MTNTKSIRGLFEAIRNSSHEKALHVAKDLFPEHLKSIEIFEADLMYFEHKVRWIGELLKRREDRRIIDDECILGLEVLGDREL